MVTVRPKDGNVVDGGLFMRKDPTTGNIILSIAVLHSTV